MFSRIIVIGSIVIAALCGIIYVQYSRNKVLSVKYDVANSQVKSMQLQHDQDQLNIDQTMKQIQKAQNDRNEMARQLAAIKDVQGLDWLHSNLPDSVRSILMPTKPAAGHQATMQ